MEEDKPENQQSEGAVELPKSKKTWKLSAFALNNLIQAFLIFASVFLAFWLNDYRTSQIEKRETHKALEAVIKEMESNLGILERWSPYHLEMLQTLESLFEQDKIKDLVDFDPAILSTDYKGFMREIITRHAWDLVQSASLQMSLDTRLDIIMVYEQQRYVEDAIKRLVEMTFQRESINPERTEENYRLLFQLLGDVYGQEMAMIANYKYRLGKLQQH